MDGVDFEALVAFVRSSSTAPQGPLKTGSPSSSANGHDPPSDRKKTRRFTPSDPCVVDETEGPRDLRERRCDLRSTFDATRLVHTSCFRCGCTCRSSTRIRPFVRSHVDGGVWCARRRRNQPRALHALVTRRGSNSLLGGSTDGCADAPERDDGCASDAFDPRRWNARTGVRVASEGGMGSLGRMRLLAHHRRKFMWFHLPSDETRVSFHFRMPTWSFPSTSNLPSPLLVTIVSLSSFLRPLNGPDWFVHHPFASIPDSIRSIFDGRRSIPSCLRSPVGDGDGCTDAPDVSARGTACGAGRTPVARRDNRTRKKDAERVGNAGGNVATAWLTS